MPYCLEVRSNVRCPHFDQAIVDKDAMNFSKVPILKSDPEKDVVVGVRATAFIERIAMVLMLRTPVRTSRILASPWTRHDHMSISTVGKQFLWSMFLECSKE